MQHCKQRMTISKQAYIHPSNTQSTQIKQARNYSHNIRVTRKHEQHVIKQAITLIMSTRMQTSNHAHKLMKQHKITKTRKHESKAARNQTHQKKQ